MTASAAVTGAAMLDPQQRRIIGYASKENGAARVELRLDGRTVRSCLAVAPAEVLGRIGFQVLGAPPTATCCFEMKAPTGATGETATVVAAGAELLSVTWSSDQELSRYREGCLMSESVKIENLRLQAGVFRARLVDLASSASPPEVALHVRGEKVGAAALAANGPGAYDLSAPVPAHVFSDGVVVVEFRLPDGSEIAMFPLAAGAALSGDLEAEVASLRAELGQLKRVFRETMAGGVIRRDERSMIVADALNQVDNLLEMRDRLDMRQSAMAADELWTDDDAGWDIEQ